MTPSISSGSTLPHRRAPGIQTVALAVLFFLLISGSVLATPSPAGEPPPAKSDPAVSPQNNNEAPLTAREQEMLALIRKLEERVARLEADAAANAKAAPIGGAAIPQQAADTPAKAPVGTAAGAAASEPVAQKTGDAGEERKKFGTYTPNRGFKLADTDFGDVNVGMTTYVRYLNQLDLDPTYTDAFGNTKDVQERQDVQLAKVQIAFRGWILDPKLTYFLYTWTSNASQGKGAQVVVAGNLNYTFNKYLTVSGGINALPGTRSVEGNFPFWLAIDSRLIADEYFRPSYTSGFWAKGQITKNLRYQAMIANNLSTLGVSAAQLDKQFNTFAGALVWTGGRGDFGVGYGDFEHHEDLVYRLAGHFSRSDEDRQSQPNEDGIENTQIRLSDGSIIFTPGIFGPGIAVTDVRYRMSAFDGGIKYRGFSLDGDYFLRWLDDFRGPGTEGLPRIFDHGFQLQASMMVIPRYLQLYAGGSAIYGDYGNPFDVRTGVNWYPWRNRIFWWNTEVLYLHKSPVGYTAVPFAVGGTGFVFHTNFMLTF